MVHSPYTTLHLVHPRPVRCSEFITLAFEALGRKGFEPVSPTEWVARLDAVVQAVEDFQAEVKRNPAVLLLPLFEMYASRMSLPGRDAFGLPMYDTTLALKVAPSLGEDRLPQTGIEDARRGVKYWRETGLIKDEEDVQPAKAKL